MTLEFAVIISAGMFLLLFGISKHSEKYLAKQKK